MANEFQRDLQRFQKNAEIRVEKVFLRAVQHVHQSIVEGSPVTGSPGQPVDTGALRASWLVRFESPVVAQISTNVDYAEIIEDNVRGARLRSSIGGFHSVKLTRVGWPNLLAAANAEVPA